MARVTLGPAFNALQDLVDTLDADTSGAFRDDLDRLLSNFDTLIDYSSTLDLLTTGEIRFSFGGDFSTPFDILSFPQFELRAFGNFSLTAFTVNDLFEAFENGIGGSLDSFSLTQDGVEILSGSITATTLSLQSGDVTVEATGSFPNDAAVIRGIVDGDLPANDVEIDTITMSANGREIASFSLTESLLTIRINDFQLELTGNFPDSLFDADSLVPFSRLVQGDFDGLELTFDNLVATRISTGELVFEAEAPSTTFNLGEILNLTIEGEKDFDKDAINAIFLDAADDVFDASAVTTEFVDGILVTLGAEGPRSFLFDTARPRPEVDFNLGREGNFDIETVIGTQGGDLLVGNSEGQTLSGSGGDDEIFGMGGADVISGGSGNDVLVGGSGDDALTGGTGADTFVFVSGFGNDTITDFDVAVDTLDLSGTGLTFQELSIAQSGADTVVSDGVGNSVTLTGVSVGSLNSSNVSGADPITVTTDLDEDPSPDGADADALDGAGLSLREALAVPFGASVIAFAPNLAGSTLQMSGGSFEFVRSTQILGDANGDGVGDITISGQEFSGVLSIRGAGIEVTNSGASIAATGIHAAPAVTISGRGSTFVNQGSIFADRTVDTGFDISQAVLISDDNVTFRNEAGATAVSQGRHAVEVDTRGFVNTRIENAGLIESADDAVRITHGEIVNSGVIQSRGDGFNGALAADGISVFGDVAAGTPLIDDIATVRVVNEEGGLISGPRSGLLASGGLVLENAGQIEGGAAAVSVQAALESPGLANSAGARITNIGELVQSGLDPEAQIFSGTGIPSAIALGHGLAERFIANEGRISAEGHGIFSLEGVVLENRAGGVIASDTDMTGDDRVAFRGSVTEDFIVEGNISFLPTQDLGNVFVSTQDVAVVVSGSELVLSTPGGTFSFPTGQIAALVVADAPRLLPLVDFDATVAAGFVVFQTDADGNFVFPPTFDLESPIYGTLTVTSDGGGGFGVTDDTGEQVISIPDDLDFADNISNAGLIEGDVLLGLGDDRFENIDGGSVDGLVDGGAGADSFVAGGSADRFAGGSGEDTVSFANSTAGVVVDLSAGTGRFGDAEGDTLTGIENLEGSAQADSLLGDGGANRFEGGDGDDRIFARAGDDVLVGGGGADILNGQAGDDTASFAGSAAGVVVDLSAGTGRFGDAEGDTLTGIENLAGSAFADSLLGDTGANLIEGGAGDDRIFARAGDDVLVGGTGADLLNGQAGIDTASFASSSAGVVVDLSDGTGRGGDAEGDSLFNIENLTGSAFSDTLLGDTDANRFEGGDGDDRIFARAGDDVLVGGAGVDLLNGQAGDDVLEGGAGADLLNGQAGDDILDGGAGDDVLEGGAGADILNGQAGIDKASFANSTAGVVVDLSAGTGRFGDAEGDTLTGIENLEGSAQADSLLGDGGANRFEGGDGDDRIFARAGDDVLVGGGGADILNGQAGDDTASFAGSAAGVVVDLSAGTGRFGDAEGDTLTGIENLAGSAFADSLLGDTGANLIEGGAGDDRIFARAGDDVLVGGTGADLLNGQAGIDTASFASSSAGVVVDLSDGTGRGGDAEGDSLFNIENLTGSAFSDTLLGDTDANRFEGGDGDDRIFARAGDDVLVGGAGADILNGQAGNDVLHGGTGDDTLQGGAGADALHGDDGFDIASFAASASGVVVDLGSRTASGGDADGDTLDSIEGVIGSGHDDELIAASDGSSLDGGAGADLLRAGAGLDRLAGGVGEDTFVGSIDDFDGDTLIDFEVGDRILFEGAQFTAHDISVEREPGGGGIIHITSSDGLQHAHLTVESEILEGGLVTVERDGNTELRFADERGVDLRIAEDDATGVFASSGGAPVNLDIAAGATVSGLADFVTQDSSIITGAVALDAGQQTIVNDGIIERGSDNYLGIEAFLPPDATGVPTRFSLTNTATGVIGGVAAGAIDRFGQPAEGLLGGVILGNGFDEVEIVNDGLIEATDLALQLWATEDGSITLTNTGTIRELATDPNIIGRTTGVTFSGSRDVLLVNSGTIESQLDSAASSDGIRLGSGVIENSGVISGGTEAIRISTGNTVEADHLTLRNATGGDISGGDQAIDVDGGLFGGDVATAPTARIGTFDIVNEVGATISGGSGVAILGLTAEDFQVSATITNEFRPNGNASVPTLQIPGVADLIFPQLDQNGFLVLDGNGNPIYPDTVESFFGTLTIVQNADGSVEVVDGTGAPIFDIPPDAATALADSVVNAGLIEGNVELGLGDDRFETEGDGRVEGSVNGGAGNDLFLMGGAVDLVFGGAGDDRIFARAGDDVLEGGGGADILNGQAGTDTASFAGSAAGVVVDLAAGTGRGGDAEGDSLFNIENLTGSAFADALLGDTGANRFEGGGGADRIFARGGDDLVLGGGGSETLFGQAGADRIFGRAGDDVLDGGAGDDALFGQAGADLFVFAGAFGSDRVADFQDGVDRLDFSGTSFDFSDLSVSQAGADTLIEDGLGNSVTLAGVDAGVIDAGDFIFAASGATATAAATAVVAMDDIAPSLPAPGPEDAALAAIRQSLMVDDGFATLSVLGAGRYGGFQQELDFF